MEHAPRWRTSSDFPGQGRWREREASSISVLKRGAGLGRALEKGGTELSDMALRFDHTVPLARYFATHRTELPAVFKRYQLGSVWRANRPQRGRFREFMQCDIDVLGTDVTDGRSRGHPGHCHRARCSSAIFRYLGSPQFASFARCAGPKFRRARLAREHGLRCHRQARQGLVTTTATAAATLMAAERRYWCSSSISRRRR